MVQFHLSEVLPYGKKCRKNTPQFTTIHNSFDSPGFLNLQETPTALR